MGGDGEELAACPDQQHLVFADVAGDMGAVGELAFGDTLGEIHSLCLGHSRLP
jgi:hypothetical protein